MDIQTQQLWGSIGALIVLLATVFSCYYASTKKFKKILQDKRATDIEIMVSMIMKQVFNLLLATGSDGKVLWKSVGNWQTSMRQATKRLSIYRPVSVAEEIMTFIINDKKIITLNDDNLDKAVAAAEKLLVEIEKLIEVPEEAYIEELHYLTIEVQNWRDGVINLIFIQCGVERVVEGTVCEHIDIISTPHRKKRTNLVQIPIIKKVDKDNLDINGKADSKNKPAAKEAK